MSNCRLDTVILKFGSSVLRTQDSLPLAVAEIYRHYRYGSRVIAVVSAFEGVTDGLLRDAKAAEEAPDPETLAALLSTGEISSAAHLVLALHRAGVPARMVDPRDIELTAAGERSNAQLSQLDTGRLDALLAETPVLVVPGFFARSAGGGLALLGRGGSDLTALYLAAELRATCILLKDVEGLYECDPATAVEAPRRFAQADYATALRCAGPLVQPKSIAFARERALTLDLARIGRSGRTRIGEGPAVIAPSTGHRRIRVALLGLGTVGGGVLDYLEHFTDRFEVVAALVRTPVKHVARGVPPSLLVQSPEAVLERNPEIIIEALPGIEPARTCLELALSADLRVVTANKALIAARWSSLKGRLSGPYRQIRYAAAVGGAVPMLEALERLSLHDPIVALRGTVNGTCSYILDRCAQGASFDQALKHAQARGLAEADPTADLSGLDAARKIEILGRVAFGGEPACDLVSGITEASCRPSDGALKTSMALIAEAQRSPSGFTFKVAPQALARGEFLAEARGAENRLEITTRSGARVRLKGLGAGRIPTATAMIADLLEHARVIDADQNDGDSESPPSLIGAALGT